MNFRVSDHISQQDEKEILDGLMEYNRKHFETLNWRDLGIYLEDEEGKKTAGIIGFTHGVWLSIKYLWVSERLRGQDIGSGLLKKAEDEARKRGCKYSFLDTFNFQAPDFYQKYGYEILFVLEEYPITGKHYYLKKNL